LYGSVLFHHLSLGNGSVRRHFHQMHHPSPVVLNARCDGRKLVETGGLGGEKLSHEWKVGTFFRYLYSTAYLSIGYCLIMPIKNKEKTWVTPDLQF